MNKKMISELQTILQYGKIAIEYLGDDYYNCNIDFHTINGALSCGDFGLEKTLERFTKSALDCIDNEGWEL